MQSMQPTAAQCCRHKHCTRVARPTHIELGFASRTRQCMSSAVNVSKFLVPPNMTHVMASATESMPASGLQELKVYKLSPIRKNGCSDHCKGAQPAQLLLCQAG